MKIDSTDLSRMAYNAIQVSSKDSSVGGMTLWGFGYHVVPDCDVLTVVASDDYVVLEDYAVVDPGPEAFTFTLDLKTLKELEKWLRDATGLLEVSFEGSLLVTGGQNPPFGGEVQGEPSEPLRNALRVVSESQPVGGFAGPFAIRQQRLTKLRLLRTPGETEYPFDLIPGQTPFGGDVLLWKLGPTLRGAVGQVDRGKLEDYFADELEVLWG